MLDNNQTIYFNTYEVTNLSNNEWQSDITKHVKVFNELKEAEVITLDQLTNLVNNNYNFWVKVINNNPYYNNDCYLVELTLMYINKVITVYVNKEVLNIIAGVETELIKTPEEKFMNCEKVTNIEFLELLTKYGIELNYSLTKWVADKLDMIGLGQYSYRGLSFDSFPKELSNYVDDLYDSIK